MTKVLHRVVWQRAMREDDPVETRSPITRTVLVRIDPMRDAREQIEAVNLLDYEIVSWEPV